MPALKYPSGITSSYCFYLCPRSGDIRRQQAERRKSLYYIFHHQNSARCNLRVKCVKLYLSGSKSVFAYRATSPGEGTVPIPSRKQNKQIGFGFLSILKQFPSWTVHLGNCLQLSGTLDQCLNQCRP